MAGRRRLSAVVVENAERDAERPLDQAAPLDVAAELDRQGSPGPAHAVVAVERAALLKNDRHARERHDVVDDGRLAEQPLDRGQRRPRPDLAALPLEALEHRGFLAADVGAGAEPDLEVEPFTRAADVPTEIALRVRRRDRGIEGAMRVRIRTASRQPCVA